MEQLPILLSIAYLPPVQYFTKIIYSKEFTIEKNEHFSKQTYRNRSVVLGANGPVNLTIPVEKSHKNKTKIKDVRIYNRMNWQDIHFKTIFSAYNSSPYYEYYEDEFSKFFQKKQVFLFDFNLELLYWIFEQLEIEPVLNFTGDYLKTPGEYKDYRVLISPKSKKKDTEFTPEHYFQVFDEKFGFIPNLSIIDLLFNEGPNSLNIIEKSFERMLSI